MRPLRYPAYPLITHSPYFSVWSPDERPNVTETVHWTGKPNPIMGFLNLEEKRWCFLGRDREKGVPAMNCRSVRVEACATEFELDCPDAAVTLRFTSPLLLDDLELLSRPVTIVTVTVTGSSGKPLAENASVTLAAGEELVLDYPGQSRVLWGELALGHGGRAVWLENSFQNPLNRSGDDVRIDWGRLYLAGPDGAFVQDEHPTAISLTQPAQDGKPLRFLFAYDEVLCAEYFGRHLQPLWREYHRYLPDLLTQSLEEAGAVDARCREFSRNLEEKALAQGGEHYAQLLLGAYRQAIAAHGICRDPEDGLLFISKECFSNGCAATADVSYPSIPLFLLYNPELVEAMAKPIFRYAESPAWPHPFAPHDAGQYPLLNGQVYGGGTDLKDQMPVEECGNLLLMCAAAAKASGKLDFVRQHRDTLARWARYLEEKGMDPENQLCTDDFAGHLAHNCNLAVKAILAIAAWGQLLEGLDGPGAGQAQQNLARDMAAQWLQQAKNEDGSFRLAFDRPGSVSLKYNAVWDKLLGLDVFPAGCWEQELAATLRRAGSFGVPLDDRAGYTKSDWELWTAAMMDEAGFAVMAELLWKAYDQMPQRVPMSDWYETADARQVGFQNRTVQGGLFLKLLAGAWADGRAS